MEFDRALAQNTSSMPFMKCNLRSILPFLVLVILAVAQAGSAKELVTAELRPNTPKRTSASIGATGSAASVFWNSVSGYAVTTTSQSLVDIDEKLPTNSTSQDPGLIKRVNQPDPFDEGPSWDTAVCRGEKLIDMMNRWQHSTPTFKAPTVDPQNPNAKFDIFKLYGYTLEGPTQYRKRFEDFEIEGLLDAAHAPRLSSAYYFFKATIDRGAVNSNPAYQIQLNPNPKYQPNYQFLIDPKSGTLIVSLALGTGVQQPDKFTRLSDISYYAYARICEAKFPSADPRGLKRIIRRDIINVSTREIIKRARNDKTAGDEAEAKTFQMGTVEFNALLGSVNGIAAGWMVVDHAKSFYAKRISRIYSHREVLHGLAFEIEDIPNSGPPPPPPKRDALRDPDHPKPDATPPHKRRRAQRVGDVQVVRSTTDYMHKAEGISLAAAAAAA